MTLKTIFRASMPVTGGGLLAALVLALVFGMPGIVSGWILGCALSYVAFKITCDFSTYLLSGRPRFAGVLAAFMMMGKFALYALGLILGFMYPGYVHVIAVFAGYFTVKITILIMARGERRDLSREQNTREYSQRSRAREFAGGHDDSVRRVHRRRQ